jgi:hypothetical protein
MYPNPADMPNTSWHAHCGITTNNSKLQVLFTKLVVDDGSDADSDSDAGMPSSNDASKQWDDSTRPWLRGFYEYLTTQDHLGDLTIIQ